MRSPAGGRTRPRPSRSTASLVAFAVAAALLLVACGGSDPVDPDALRLERIDARLRTSFSDAQADCILDGLTDDQQAALDRKATLPPDDEELAGISTLVSFCVLGGEAEATTTTAADGATTSTTAAG